MQFVINIYIHITTCRKMIWVVVTHLQISFWSRTRVLRALQWKHTSPSIKTFVTCLSSRRTTEGHFLPAFCTTHSTLGLPSSLPYLTLITLPIMVQTYYNLMLRNLMGPVCIHILTVKHLSGTDSKGGATIFKVGVN